MIREAGELALIGALLCAFLQSTLPLLGAYKKQNPYLLAFARPSALGQFVFVAIAYLLLTIAFGMNDFSIAYVAANSHPALPLMYRLTAVWGAHEGSILFWILILNIWTMAFTFLQSNNPQRPLVLAILGCISFGFLCFLLFTSNPFLPAVGQTAGHDLNPLLQDPGFVIHPPMLYAGYVGFSVAFAITQAALLRGQLDAAWAKVTRQFALAAWCFLTLGITLGSWWAYRVLGWGGFWFWDPVENASLLPWLAGTAFIHVLVLAEKRNVAKNWAALLAIVCFALSLLGTFLVRSGVLISTHTFATDPKRGLFLLLLLAIVLTLAVAIYLFRAPATLTKPPYSWLSRETELLLNSALLFLAMCTVLLGTLYPLIIDALHLGTISVGAPYFNKVMMPLVFITMFFMGLAPLCRWQAQPLKELIALATKNLIISIVAAPAILWGMMGHIEFTACLSLGLSVWVALSIWQTPRKLPGMALAHVGFAALIIGIMLSSLLSVEKDVRMNPGDSTTLGPYQFLFIDAKGLQGPNYRGIRAAFEVMKGSRHIANMYPEKRIYTVRDMVMTTTAIDPGIFRDLYIALGEPLNQTAWSVRLYYKPFIRWIWFGGGLMMLGGLLTLLRREKTTCLPN